jgi:hypothetical protein
MGSGMAYHKTSKYTEIMSTWREKFEPAILAFELSSKVRALFGEAAIDGYNLVTYIFI